MGNNGGEQERFVMISCPAKDVIDAFIDVGEAIAVMGMGKNPRESRDFILLVNFDLKHSEYWKEKKVGGVELTREDLEFMIKAFQRVLEEM